MIHGAFFRSELADSTEEPLDPVDQLDGTVREFSSHKEAFLVGVSAYGANLQYIKITNDLWNDREYLYVPALGTYTSGSAIWWLPSPIKIIVGSDWTVEGFQDSGGAEYDEAILFISYAPVLSATPRGGIISRVVSGTAIATDAFTDLGIISDLEPNYNYFLIGCSGGLSVASIALRIRADSFNGLNLVFPAIRDVALGPGGMINELPEGMPIMGTEAISVDIFQTASQATKIYVFLAREEI